jgi:hypothetical protein
MFPQQVKRRPTLCGLVTFALNAPELSSLTSTANKTQEETQRMIKRESKEIIRQFDADGNLVSETETTTMESDDNTYGVSGGNAIYNIFGAEPDEAYGDAGFAEPGVCNQCGKELDEYDLQQNFRIRTQIGYGSKLDGLAVDMRLCSECFDVLVESCSINPVF